LIINTVLYIALAINIKRLFGTPGRHVFNTSCFISSSYSAFMSSMATIPTGNEQNIASAAAGIILAAIVTMLFIIVFYPYLTKPVYCPKR